MDNLSGWDIHCRMFLRKEFPYLFKLIKKFLPAYRKMRKKYGWGEKNLERYFVEPDLKQVKRNLQKLPKKDQYLILKIIDVLDKEIKPHWTEKEEILKCLIRILEKYWKKYSQKAITEIEQFLDLKVPRKIEVFILFTLRGTSGGGNIGKKGVTLEIGDLRMPLINSFDVLLHELIHFIEIVDDRDTEKKLEKYGLKRKGELLIREAIVGLLCPKGFLSEKLKIGKFKISKYRGDKHYETLFKYKKLLQKIVSDYFKNKEKQNYWEDFLPKVAAFIKKKRLKKTPLR